MRKGVTTGKRRIKSGYLELEHMRLEEIFSGEMTPERMKGWSQSKNNTQLWMRLVIEAML